MIDSPSMVALHAVCDLRLDLLTNHPELLAMLAPSLIHAEVAIREIDEVAYRSPAKAQS